MQMGTTQRRSAGCVRARTTSTATARTQAMLLSSAVPTQSGRSPESPGARELRAERADERHAKRPRRIQLAHPVSSAVPEDLY